MIKLYRTRGNNLYNFFVTRFADKIIEFSNTVGYILNIKIFIEYNLQSNVMFFYWIFKNYVEN